MYRAIRWGQQESVRADDLRGHPAFSGLTRQRRRRHCKERGGMFDDSCVSSPWRALCLRSIRALARLLCQCLEHHRNLLKERTQEPCLLTEMI
jgi:hypothetical protein